MSIDLARRLLAAGAVQRDELQRALLKHATKGVPLVRALLEGGAIVPRALDDEIARSEMPGIRTVVPILRLYEALPSGMCRALLALPVRQDGLTGTVDVATIDPFNQHVEREFAHHLRAPIRLIRAPLAAIDEAFRRLEHPDEVVPSRERRQTPPPISPRASRRTPAYLTRPDFDALDPSPGVPQLRRPISEIPIPLVKRSEAPGRLSMAPGAPELAPPRVPTVRPDGGPFSARAPRGPFPDVAPLLDALKSARSRDEVVDLLINGLAMVAARVGIFVVRKGDFCGWRCNEAMADQAAFREVRVAGAMPSVLATAAATGFYLGPVPRTAAHADLLRVMGGMSSEVAATPLRVEGRLAMVVLLDELGDSMLATKRADELGTLAGEALGRIVARDKQGLSPPRLKRGAGSPRYQPGANLPGGRLEAVRRGFR